MHIGSTAAQIPSSRQSAGVGSPLYADPLFAPWVLPSGALFKGLGVILQRLFLATCVIAAMPSYADCIASAAVYHRVDIQLLQAIVMQESSGNAKALNCANRNKTCDYGLTQTNSIHLARLKKHGVAASDLFNPCVSAYVGAWILAENFERYGVTWDAVGAYNASHPEKRRKYADAIKAKVRAIRAGKLIPIQVPDQTSHPQRAEPPSATNLIAEKQAKPATSIDHIEQALAIPLQEAL